MLQRIFIKIYNYYYSPEKAFVRRLKEILGFIPCNIPIFRRAFEHRASSQSDGDDYYGSQNNERLEYLGDAVLGTIVAEYLYRKYPNKDEGFLTKMRSKAVNRKTLNDVGEQMGLDEFLMEENDTNKLSRTMLGNALEAFVGAIYIDVGYYRTRRYVISKILMGYLDIEHLETYDDNYKSQLLEWCQKNRKEIKYKTISKTKVDNRDFFRVAVLVDEHSVAEAEDFSKKSAEQKASYQALQKMGIFRKRKGKK